MKPPIFFKDQGKGFPVILVHGFCENHHIWDGFADDLAKHFRVITPDLPGFGESPLLPTPFSIDDVARHLHSGLAQLGLKKSILIGHSLGGYVSLAMAKQNVDAFAGIGLFHSTAFADSEEKKANRDKTIDFVNKNGVGLFAGTFVQGLFYDKKHQYLTRVNQIAASTPLDTVVSYSSAMRDRPSFDQFLRSLRIYLLVVAGIHDSIIPVGIAKQVADLAPKSFYTQLANAAHMGMIEDREVALHHIIEFCNKCVQEDVVR